MFFIVKNVWILITKSVFPLFIYFSFSNQKYKKRLLFKSEKIIYRFIHFLIMYLTIYTK